MTLLDNDDANIFKESLIFAHCGTPGYLAPEIFQECKFNTDLTDKSDIFSMGIIFYMISTKKPLYFGSDWK
jgi:serine/threonine protein kinase